MTAICSKLAAPLLIFLYDHITQGVGDTAAKNRCIYKDLVDVEELVGCLGEQLYQELAAFRAVGAIDLLFFTVVGEAIGQAIKEAGAGYDDGVYFKAFLQDLFGV